MRQLIIKRKFFLRKKRGFRKGQKNVSAEGEILTGGQSEKSLSADILLAEVSKTFSLFEKVGM